MDGSGNSEVAHHEILQDSRKSLACFCLFFVVVCCNYSKSDVEFTTLEGFCSVIAISMGKPAAFD